MKKKLSLKLEELRVDSFATVGTDKERGTVAAHEDTERSVCWGCEPEATRYEYTCQSCTQCRNCTQSCATVCLPF